MKLIVLVLATWLVTAQIEATTVSTLVTRFRSDIGESDSLRGRFTNTQVRDLLTRGTQVVADLTGEIEDDTTITLVATQAEYRLPSDFKAVISVKVKKGYNYVNLDEVDNGEFGIDIDGNLESGTLPKKFTIFNDSLRIAPAVAYYKSGEKLYVNYLSNITALTSSSQSTQLPAWSDQLVVSWGVYFANERNYTPEQREAARQGLTGWTDDILGRFIKPQIAPKVQPTVTP